MKLSAKSKLEGLLDLLIRLNSEKTVKDLLIKAAEETTDIIGCDKASIFLLDRDENALWSIATTDGSIIKFDARLGLAGEVVLTGKTLLDNNVRTNKKFYKGIDAQTGYETKKILIVPIFNNEDQIIGTFQTLNKKRANFTKNDEELMQLIAKQIAVSIENAKLLEDSNLMKELLLSENSRLKNELRSNFSTQIILGNSDPIQNIVRLIEQISDINVDVLISGKSGTGKELVAKAIHYNGLLSDKPFVSINCAAIPESLFESELFGIEKGIATGVEKRIGKFEKANGGTLFLDEIGDLNHTCQAKILRALQERVIERVGGNQLIPVNVRVIAATNKNLDEEIKSGTFRDDLYFRLKVVNINTPSLNSIPEDIPLLAQNFLNKFCNELDKEIKKLSSSAINALKNYNWPGNVRELENEMKRLVILCPKNTIQKQDLSDNIKLSNLISNNTKNPSLKQAVEELEKKMIIQALRINNANKVKTASYLGLSRWGLVKKIKRYGLTD